MQSLMYGYKTIYTILVDWWVIKGNFKNLHIITIESLVNVNTIANTYHCEEHPNDRITSQV